MIIIVVVVVIRVILEALHRANQFLKLLENHFLRGYYYNCCCHCCCCFVVVIVVYDGLDGGFICC